MELRFLAVHEEGASLMVPPRDKAIRAVLVLQNPRALSDRRSWPKDQFEREIAPPMRIRSSRLAVVTTLPTALSSGRRSRPHATVLGRPRRGGDREYGGGDGAKHGAHVGPRRRRSGPEPWNEPDDRGHEQPPNRRRDPGPRRSLDRRSCEHRERVGGATHVRARQSGARFHRHPREQRWRDVEPAGGPGEGHGCLLARSFAGGNRRHVPHDPDGAAGHAPETLGTNREHWHGALGGVHRAAL